MKAKSLELLIAGEARHRGYAELVQRFQNLRNTSLFPKSRGMHADHLTMHQIVTGILSIVPIKPGYTMYALGLPKLLPVGGAAASFLGADSLGKAIELLIQRKDALDIFLEMRVSCSEIDDNEYHGCGTAQILYQDKGQIKIAYFVGETAVSQLQPGMEKEYNPRVAMLQIRDETVFYPQLFKRIFKSLEDEQLHDAQMYGHGESTLN